jgi:hypothetical protein
VPERLDSARVRELEQRLDTATSAAASEMALLRADVGGRITALQLRLDDAELAAGLAREEQRRVTTRLTLIIALLVIVLAGGTWWTVQLQRQMLSTTDRLAAVEQQSARALKDTADQLAAAKADLQRREADARQAASDAATMSGVLAAPDLVRYGLTGADGSGVVAQVLWSRSRGLVFSATRLAPAVAGSTYQLWLAGADGVVSAGTLLPDEEGRATLVRDARTGAPRSITGVLVTIEAAGGAAVPSARVVAAWHAPRPTP